MNDMTDSDWMRSLTTTPLNDPKHPLSWANGCDRLESIATKMERYPDLARAVLQAWFLAEDKRLNNEFRKGLVGVVKTATGKHPSDWTRDGLMKHLGIAQEESK